MSGEPVTVRCPYPNCNRFITNLETVFARGDTICPRCRGEFLYEVAEGKIFYDFEEKEDRFLENGVQRFP
jgi:hypothetical protein